MKKYTINLIFIMLFLLSGQFLMNSNFLSGSYKTAIIHAGIYIIGAVSLNITVGYLGKFTFGYAGFMAVGAYTAAILVKSGLNFLIALILDSIFTSIFGILTGFLTIKFQGDYLAIIILEISEIIRITITNLTPLTGGAQGLKSIPKYSNFMLVYISVAVICLILKFIMNSRHGRARIAIRENEIAVKSVGINVGYYNILAFAISAFFAGLSGGLLAGSKGILVPNEFGFLKSVEILTIVILGGMGSMIDSIVSAIILTFLPFLLQTLLKDFNSYRMIIYALLLILFMIFKPFSLFGTYKFSISKILKRRKIA